MNILFLAEPLEPTGVTTYARNLTTGLAGAGHSVTMFTKGGPLKDRIAAKRVAVQDMPSGMLSAFTRVAASRIASHFKITKPDIVHALSRPLWSVARRVSTNLGIPAVVTVHHYYPKAKRMRPAPEEHSRFVAISESIRAHLVNDMRVPKNLVVTIVNGVEVPGMPAVRTAENGTVAIGGAGRLVPEKGYRFLVKAVAKIIHGGRDVELIIVGDGPERRNLEAEARKLGIRNRVTLLPPRPDFDMILNSFDIFVVPSLSEGLGIAIIEAMASGKPVVASGVGGTFTVLKDGESGYLVPPGDVNALARKITALVDSPELRTEIGAAGRDKAAEDFDVKKMLEQTVALYSSLKEREGA